MMPTSRLQVSSGLLSGEAAGVAPAGPAAGPMPSMAVAPSGFPAPACLGRPAQLTGIPTATPVTPVPVDLPQPTSPAPVDLPQSTPSAGMAAAVPSVLGRHTPDGGVTSAAVPTTAPSSTVQGLARSTPPVGVASAAAALPPPGPAEPARPDGTPTVPAADPPATPAGPVAWNSHKAGLSGVDAAWANRVIEEASRGSRFYEAAQRKAATVADRVAALAASAARLRSTPGALTSATATADEELAAIEASERDLARRVVHVDLDAFYSAVAERDDPSLVGKPHAAGGMSMLCTASYEARKYGVRSAMPGFVALRLCPSLILVPIDIAAVKATSARLRDHVFPVYDPNFVMASLDEAYLDVTAYMAARPHLSLDDVLTHIRSAVAAATRLTCSAGGAPNKLLAKLASDVNKPNGQTVIQATREAVLSFISPLPVRKVPGIGSVTASLLGGVGVHTCADLVTHRALVVALFSPRSAKSFLRAALGVSGTTVAGDGTGGRLAPRKGASRESTFTPTADAAALTAILTRLVDRLAADLGRLGARGRTVTLKVKDAAFAVRSRSVSLPLPVGDDAPALLRVAAPLLAAEAPAMLRLVGVRVSGLDAGTQAPVIGKQQGTLDAFVAGRGADEVPPTSSGEGAEGAAAVSDEHLVVSPAALTAAAAAPGDCPPSGAGAVDSVTGGAPAVAASRPEPPRPAAPEPRDCPVADGDGAAPASRSSPAGGPTASPRPPPSPAVPPPTPPTLPTIYVCPACGLFSVPAADEARLHRHLDACVERGSPPAARGGRKRKQPDSVRRIDHFFPRSPRRPRGRGGGPSPTRVTRPPSGVEGERRAARE